MPLKYVCMIRRNEHTRSTSLKYVTPLWALVTSQKILVVGSYQESTHEVVSNCKSRRLSFQILEAKLRYENHKSK